MALEFFGHPFSSYCQKVLVALYENDTPFTFRHIHFDGSDPATLDEFSTRWPLRRMPLLLDGGQPVVESSIIIEYLGLHHPGPVRLLPDRPEPALEARLLDRFFDNYIHTPLQKIVFDAIRQPEQRDAKGVTEARATLDTAYAWADRRLEGREWAVGEGFSLADCAAAPALFYADWAHPIPEDLPRLRAYRARLNAHPSFARAIDEGRPYRQFFPLGAPDRD
ncbi:MAG TPA: glutathione S-transferase family protein [Mesorhizobium sp.]|jgi:glutathione S-transferase|nr:glutathione S-transferase family protein [Mesorhizobium sp.]